MANYTQYQMEQAKKNAVEQIKAGIVAFIASLLTVGFWTWITPFSFIEVTTFTILVTLTTFALRMYKHFGLS